MEKPNYTLFEQANTLWSILDTAIDGIILINKRGIIQIVNSATHKMFGWEITEMLGQNVSMLMSSQDKPNHDQYIRNYLETGERKIIGTGREVVAKHKSGRTFPIRLAVSQVILNEEIFFTGILHDLSAQKTAEAQLVKFTQELESKVQARTEELNDVVNKLLKVNKQYQAEIAERILIETALKKKEEELQHLLSKEKEINQMKSRFVSMASHEFRTPLATVLSSASLIEKYPESSQQDKRERHVKKIRNAVENLTNILNDFLSLGKLEEGQIDPKFEVIPLESFCNELIEEMSLILKSGQEIIFNYSLDTETFKTEPRFLQNSLVNIISNAIKYSPENKPIYFTVCNDSNGVLFEIKDEGMGIPEPEQVHLFNRFFRANNATNIQGTGLGLHIVKRYMELMKGKVTFESELQVGSTFSLHHPIIE